MEIFGAAQQRNLEAGDRSLCFFSLLLALFRASAPMRTVAVRILCTTMIFGGSVFLTILGSQGAQHGRVHHPRRLLSGVHFNSKKKKRKTQNRRHSKAFGGSGFKARNSQERVEARGGQCWSQCQRSDSHVKQRSLLNKHKKTRMSSDFLGRSPAVQRSGGPVVCLWCVSLAFLVLFSWLLFWHLLWPFCYFSFASLCSFALFASDVFSCFSFSSGVHGFRWCSFSLFQGS